ncbi:AMP-binding enzyme [Cupriavidus basilensis]
MSARCLVVMKRPGAEVTREELLKYFEGKVAKWWIPDDVAFVTEIPLTATGKMQKTQAARAIQGLPPAGGLTPSEGGHRAANPCRPYGRRLHEGSRRAEVSGEGAAANREITANNKTEGDKHDQICVRSWPPRPFSRQWVPGLRLPIR